MPGFFVETTQSGFPEFFSVSQAIRNEISLEKTIWKINTMVFGSQSKSNWLSIIFEQSISTSHIPFEKLFSQGIWWGQYEFSDVAWCCVIYAKPIYYMPGVTNMIFPDHTWLIYITLQRYACLMDFVIHATYNTP